MAARLGGSPAAWSISEVGDGNLNLVFIVKGAKRRHRRQAGAALCAPGRRELAAAALALALRTSGAGASGPAGARAGAGRAAPRRGARPHRDGAARAAHHHAQGTGCRHLLSPLRRSTSRPFWRGRCSSAPTSRFRPPQKKQGIAAFCRQPRAVQDHRGPDLYRSLLRWPNRTAGRRPGSMRPPPPFAKTSTCMSRSRGSSSNSWAVRKR